ncbi:hypothetical protein AXG93_1040s1150 [Marchantia polymorpha subsp. ruderalis]|uniref:Uncharacterized protein n=1 Tax=Marchantia polymorpha subsp. ruderalis TaxID=1480154 RepID=A0A176VGJ8_MARPO|nr:hypothetical protein AXG93_1040s1150 [Marchantia polymorpha subsp. ruderalis]
MQLYAERLRLRGYVADAARELATGLQDGGEGRAGQGRGRQCRFGENLAMGASELDAAAASESCRENFPEHNKTVRPCRVVDPTLCCLSRWPKTRKMFAWIEGGVVFVQISPFLALVPFDSRRVKLLFPGPIARIQGPHCDSTVRIRIELANSPGLPCCEFVASIRIDGRIIFVCMEQEGREFDVDLTYVVLL